MTIGFGIVGCGMIADFHARAIDDLPGAQLVGCVDQHRGPADQFAGKHQCRSFENIDQFLGDNSIEAVTICTPSGAHLEPALAAAAAGKHVIVEKPLEVTLGRCDQIIEACDKHGVVLSTVFQSRFHESSQLLKKAVDVGKFGRLSLGNAYVKWFRTQEYYDSGDWRGTWKLDGGGALMNQAIHNVDLLCWIMGRVKSLSANVATVAHERIEVEDTAVACLEFANGSLGTIEATTAAFPGSPKRLEIFGAQGSAAIEDENICHWQFADQTLEDEQIVERFSKSSSSGAGASDPSAIDYTGHMKQLENVIAAIERGGKPLVDGPESRKSVEIVLAVYEAAKSGRSVQLDD